jgi:hypothetical protein
VKSNSMFLTPFFVGVVAVLSVIVASAPLQAADPPQTVRDLLWVWGNPEMATPGEHTVATFASASPAQRAILLGVPNVMMAGTVPDDDQEAEALANGIAAAPRQAWEISTDSGGLPFVYTNRMAQVRKLVDKYPQVEGVTLDDMSTGLIDAGLKPDDIQAIRDNLPGKYQSVKIWGVTYSMNLNDQGLADYLNKLDVISLWVWNAQDVVHLTDYVTHCEQLAPGKSIVVGIYLHDYGAEQPMPLDLLQQECETALQLVHAGRIDGMSFLTITDDPGAEAVSWAADWISQVGGQPVPEPSTLVLLATGLLGLLYYAWRKRK